MCETCSARPRTPYPGGSLSNQERAALRVLLGSQDRVIGRRELSRQIGLTEVNERRCDSLLVGIRRVLGSDAIRTVRGRGWILTSSAVPAAIDLLQADDDRAERDI